MSYTTINMIAVKSASGSSTETVDKLYSAHGIEKPMRVVCEPNIVHPAIVYNDVVIDANEVKHNAMWYEQYHTVLCSPDRIVEELVLNDHISINVEYIAI
ncbi:MAG: hypothetical protein DRH37_02890 [Deltaproteobacteria bacterium]|nr:MAG: hypothetical protein DRH37_02890 [Deltaproteobacteria bacterium]